jgi:hypothetical protein
MQWISNCRLSAAESGEALGPVTGDYLEAIAATGATVSSDVADEFLQDIELIARV